MNIFDRQDDKDGKDTPKFIKYFEGATSDIQVLINLTEKFLKYIFSKSKIIDLDYVINELKIKGAMMEYKNKMLTGFNKLPDQSQELKIISGYD